MLTLVRTEQLLRRRMVLGGVGMGCFTILSTALSFLARRPAVLLRLGHHRAVRPRRAGRGGAAVFAGRFADRGHGRRVVTVGLGILLLSWLLLGFGGASLVALLAGIVALDLAQQMLQISHQSAIYTRVPHARSRVTTAYIVAVFIGGGLASLVTSVLYASVGWVGVCVLGAAVTLLGIGTWTLELLRPSPSEPPPAAGTGVTVDEVAVDEVAQGDQR